MAIDRQVQCIIKRHRPGPHERIQAIGGLTPAKSLLGDPTNWQENEDIAIIQIRGGTHTYYTMEGGKRANVRIGKHTTDKGTPKERAHEYLTTEADGYPPNNLLSLPDCPLKK
jgi:hypothetical protein